MLRRKDLEEIVRKKLESLLKHVEEQTDPKTLKAGINCALKARHDGTTTNTGRGLDVAISQNGFFRLVDSNGSVFYSRNGQFKLDE
ncbi:hypothetical protein MJM95_28225, partial [Salmonella enterica subsp. enterica serovar Anatum]|nr:hypothetical protein [Salmonella enterica subsp. enterica serovar Anatum]